MPPKTLGVGDLAVSPDGRRIAFRLNSADSPPQVFVRALDELEAKAVPGTQPGYGPFWSPDSRQLAFWRLGEGLQKVDLASGRVERVCRDCMASGIGAGVETGASWGSAGDIVFSDVGKLDARVGPGRRGRAARTARRG